MARRGTYAKGVVKRDEILRKALTVIAQQGYRAASVREIARAAGISPAGLLHYFGSKEELFVAILQARDEQDERDHRGEDNTEAFLAVVRHNASVPGLVQLYAQLAAEAGDAAHPAHEFFRERTERFEAVSREAIAAKQEEGEIRTDLDPAWIVRTLHAIADGLQTAWLIDPDLDMAAHLEQFLATLHPAR